MVKFLQTSQQNVQTKYIVFFTFYWNSIFFCEILDFRFWNKGSISTTKKTLKYVEKIMDASLQIP